MLLGAKEDKEEELNVLSFLLLSNRRAILEAPLCLPDKDIFNVALYLLFCVENSPLAFFYEEIQHKKGFRVCWTGDRN